MFDPTQYQQHNDRMRRQERAVRFVLVIFGMGLIAGLLLAHFGYGR